MGAFFFALIALCAIAILKLPGAAYNATSNSCSRESAKIMDEWKKLVTIDPDEEHAIYNELIVDLHAYLAGSKELYALIDKLKEQYPGYNGGYGHEVEKGNPVGPEVGIHRMILAKRGKLKLADALFGITGNSDDLPFILWIDSQLKEHGINERLYFQEHFSTIHLIDDIPKNMIGEYRWDPQINVGRKRPDK